MALSDQHKDDLTDQAFSERPRRTALNKAELERARREVLRKIKDEYALNDEDLTLPASLVPQLDFYTNKMLKEDHWQKRLKHVGMDTPVDRREEATALAHELMNDYLTLFHLRRTVTAAIRSYHASADKNPHSDFYNSPLHSATLTGIYANHVMNDAQTRLTLLTGNPETAFALHTCIIANVMYIAKRNSYFAGFSYLDPETDREDPAAKNIRFWLRTGMAN